MNLLIFIEFQKVLLIYEIFKLKNVLKENFNFVLEHFLFIS